MTILVHYVIELPDGQRTEVAVGCETIDEAQMFIKKVASQFATADEEVFGVLRRITYGWVDSKYTNEVHFDHNGTITSF